MIGHQEIFFPESTTDVRGDDLSLDLIGSGQAPSSEILNLPNSPDSHVIAGLAALAARERNSVMFGSTDVADRIRSVWLGRLVEPEINETSETS